MTKVRLCGRLGGAGLCLLAMLFLGASVCEGGAPRGAQQQAAPTPGGGSGPAAEAQAWFAKGQEALQRGELDAAEAAFRKVLAIDPQAGSAYANLGVIAMRRKQWDHALALLEKAEKLEPRMRAGVRLNIGLVKYRRGDYSGAIVPLAAVVREQPDSVQGRYLLGLSEVFTQDYGEAVAALEPLWPKMSDNFMYLYVLGIAAHNAGRKELDEQALTRLLQVGGDSPEFHLILGKAYLNREEKEKALVELNRAEAGNPDLPYLHLSLGIAYSRSNDSAQAEAEFRKDVAIEPDLPDNYEQLGELYLRAGQNDEAEKAFQDALRRNSHLPASLFGLAKLYLQEEKYPAALKAIDSAVHLVPDDQSIHYVRAQILLRLDRRAEAQSEFAAAQKILNSGLAKRRQSLENSQVPNPELAEPPQ